MYLILVVYTRSMQVSYSLTQRPSQWHNCVQSKFALMHLHLPEQVFLQLHLISSLQLLAASGREVQNGTQVSSFFVHPQSLGLGNSGFAIMA